MRTPCPPLLPTFIPALALGLALAGAAHGDEANSADVPLPAAKAVPALQMVPLPDEQLSFQWDGREIARYHYGSRHRRPFVYPIVGPSGHTLTRMGHPHDPVGHSHHESFWVSHHAVAGVDFWGDHGQGKGRIVHVALEQFSDGDDAASARVLNEWRAPDGRALLRERRRYEARALPAGEWLLVLDLEIDSAGESTIEIESTPFGIVGVRVAKTIGVHDGGGLIRNSAGQRNEQGKDGAFRKPARWVDYSGPLTDEVRGGLTLMDHPRNPNHPNPFHVRDDGWMGVCATLERGIEVGPGNSLRLRYGLFVHRGVPAAGRIDAVWSRFAGGVLAPLASEGPR